MKVICIDEKINEIVQADDCEGNFKRMRIYKFGLSQKSLTRFVLVKHSPMEYEPVSKFKWVVIREYYIKKYSTPLSTEELKEYFVKL